jgi:hypothetical protein
MYTLQDKSGRTKYSRITKKLMQVYRNKEGKGEKGQRKTECLQNSLKGKIWKMTTWKTEKEVGNNIQMNLGEMG